MIQADVCVNTGRVIIRAGSQRTLLAVMLRCAGMPDQPLTHDRYIHLLQPNFTRMLQSFESVAAAPDNPHTLHSSLRITLDAMADLEVAVHVSSQVFSNYTMPRLLTCAVVA